ncbi:MAG: arylsulfatase, partial [Candidatus Pacebacteria bacterium]|nr:arylsulfatase [Candidatus Paceibacterota bacterium]
MQSKPNVVFVLTDDQGYPPFGCHGHPFIKTPNLDAFHERSVHMEQFHVGPTCAPTRAGLLTGHYSNSTGVWHTIGGRSLLRANEWTLADALREDGYRTALFGKWHLGDESPYVPHERGFETAIYHGGGGVSQSHDYWGNDYFDDTYWVNGTPKQFKGYCTDVFFGEALTYIEEHKDEPFFCYISTNAPHAPYNIDNAYYDLYKDKTDSEEYARFLGMITNIDENFGKLQAKLEELNIADNTILIFMSDNGQCGYAARGESNVYNCGMRGMKGSEYEGGHRAPFLLRYPNGGLDAERAIDDVTAFVDFMPTILDLCNVQVPQERTFHGRSIVPLLRGETDDEWRTRCVVTDSQRLVNPVKWKQSCVLRDTLRLVDRDELYDIATDPSQEHDIAADHPEIVEELRTAYEEWWTIVSQQFDDEIPISIGTPSRTEARLNAHDLRNEDMNIA